VLKGGTEEAEEEMSRVEHIGNATLYLGEAQRQGDLFISGAA
jgi:hypothetical protein